MHKHTKGKGSAAAMRRSSDDNQDKRHVLHATKLLCYDNRAAS